VTESEAIHSDGAAEVTGCREDEVAHVRWTDIRWEAKEFFISEWWNDNWKTKAYEDRSNEMPDQERKGRNCQNFRLHKFRYTYGQKHDVVVVNFLNKKNAADQRVYQLLDEKFKLFHGVFGASDEVLGSIGSGMDWLSRSRERRSVSWGLARTISVTARTENVNGTAAVKTSLWPSRNRRRAKRPSLLRKMKAMKLAERLNINLSSARIWKEQ
jgi:hypothetical protein